jgi:YidC/Oxa1 family membrane protein insertase
MAIALSLLVLLGWQYFVVGPQTEQAHKQAQIAAQQKAAQQEQQQQTQAAASQNAANAGTSGTVTSPTAQAPSQQFADAAAALAGTPRIKIDTPAIAGSLNLVGARLDDVRLKTYHETVDKSSPIITLLYPASAKGAYFADQGWVSPDNSVPVPGPNTQWTIVGGTRTLTSATPVTLHWDNGHGVIFQRTIAVDDHYLFTVTQSVVNTTGAPISLLPYARAVRNGTPQVQNTFYLHEGAVGVLTDKNLVQYKYSDLQKDGTIDIDSNGGWLGYSDKYWAAVVMPEPKTAISGRFGWSKPGQLDDYQASYVDKTPVTIAPGGTGEAKSYVFAGAKEDAVLSAYESQYGFDRLELLIDWGWFQIITKPMFYLLQFLYGIIGNFGLSILALTVIIKGIFFPLANRSYASMAAMRRVQPQMKEIQERFKEDRTKQQQAIMELYKKEKINPISGCWPMLIQIPVFYALYTVLFISLEMRHAPFFGWIQDLAAPDPSNIFTLFGLLNWDPTVVPVIGHFLILGVWPIIMGITMWLQMKLQPPPPDPTQAMIFQLMPVVFTFMLGSFPAGLVIYYCWNNTLSIIQQSIIMKRHGAKVDLIGNIAASFRRSPSKAEGK